MKEIDKLLDENLKYFKHEVTEERIAIWVELVKFKKEKVKLELAKKNQGTMQPKVTQEGKYQN